MKIFERALAALDRTKAWLPVLLRVAIGATFIYHGYPKMKNYAETVEKMSGMNMPLASVLSPLVPIVEFVGGICVVVGLGTRVWAFLQAITMVFAIVFVHWSKGFSNQTGGWEWQALLLAGCLTLVLGGPGVLSIDQAIRSRMQPADVRR